jgi:L-alanine-DL-glutamate epimerase-like enolase superfamily enzyme
MQRRDFFKAAALLPASVGGVGFASAATLGKQIKITGLETELRERLQPSGRVTYDAIHKFDGTGGGVVVRLLTDAGITGWGSSSFGMIGGAPRVLQTILEQEVKPVIVGKDPAFPKKIRADLWAALEYAGVQGVTQFAIAAIDIAVWDIIGKAAGQPVYKLIGGFRDRMPVYSMCGWYFDEKDNDLSIYKHVLDEAMQQGYRAVKIKVGRFSLDDDIKRIKIAQDTVGKDKRVLVDANQVFNRKEALRRGRVYQQMGCFWFEEPLPPYDVEGCAELAKELDMRIASGENLYTRFAFANWIGHRASDVVQPDNRRAGGLTEWMEIAAIADGFGIEVASHGGGATNLNMLLAMPNAIYMETSGPQANMVNGEVPGPQEPGMSTETRRGYPGREF